MKSIESRPRINTLSLGSNGCWEQVQKAAAGDDAAREALYRWAFPSLHRFLFFQSGGDAETTADLCSDVFVLVFRDLEKLQRTEAFWPWLLRIASNRLADFQRQAVRRRKSDEMMKAEALRQPLSAPSPEEQFERTDEHARLGRAFSCLTPDHQEAMKLCFVEDLSHAEIGERMGRSEKAIESLLARAREALRKEMKNLCEHEK